MKVLPVPEDVRRSLLQDEMLVWCDRPRQGIVLKTHDSYVVPFTLLWCGFAIVIGIKPLRTAIFDPREVVSALIPAFLIVIGLFLTFGRFVLDRWLRKRTTYVLTDRRILLVRSGPFASIKAIHLDHLPEMTLTGLSGGWGTICFGRSASDATMDVWIASLGETPKFLDIADARQVFAAVQVQANALRERRPAAVPR